MILGGDFSGIAQISTLFICFISLAGSNSKANFIAKRPAKSQESGHHSCMESCTHTAIMIS